MPFRPRFFTCLWARLLLTEPCPRSRVSRGMRTHPAGADLLTAHFRFHHELNDFIAWPNREREFNCPFPPNATAKHMIEALGVPHTEVALVFIDGKEVNMGQRLQPGDRVCVYPLGYPMGPAPAARAPGHEPGQLQFVADAHLGGLARLLRMAGFDTLYDNAYQDSQIAQLSRERGRIVLSRDRDLLKRRDVVRGCYVRTCKPDEQIKELAARYGLAERMRPLALCLCCNVELVDVDGESIQQRVPPAVKARIQRFKTCPGCLRIYWEGTHWRQMRRMLDDLLPASGNRLPVKEASRD